MIQIGINSEILTQILDGRKTVEGRLAKGKFLTIHPGDMISIREDIYKDGAIADSRDKAAIIQVTDIKKFESFKDMLVAEGFQNVIPHTPSLDEACNEYKRYYSHEDEKEHGVLAISFRVLPL